MKKRGFGVKGLMLGLSVAGAFFFYGAAGAADEPWEDPPSLEGSYKGKMIITDDGRHEIPLELFLRFTEEMRKVEVNTGVFEMQKVIVGSFLVDEEGEAYSFSQVVYRFNTSEVDLRYTRTRGVTLGQPPSFRLLGKFGEDGSLKGEVLAAFRMAGTFELNKVPSTPLVARKKSKYVGDWRGVITLREGDKNLFDVSIAADGLPNTNPDKYIFDDTPGMLGSMIFGIAPTALPNVVVDYLHRKIVLSNTPESGKQGVVVVATLDPSTNRLTGKLKTAFGADRGNFVLEKEQEQEEE